MRRLALATTFSLTACITPVHSADPLLRGPWQVTLVDGAPFLASGTLSFDANGTLAGQAPCNRWSATNAATLPDLRLTNIIATEIGCDALAEETRFFQALATMETATLPDPDRLLLEGPEGRQMVFRRLIVIPDT